MKILSVVNWDRFQHYKDRDPPWVKFYRDTFTSETWVLGTDLSRLVQTASLLLSARYSNAIPYKFEHLKKVLSLDCTEAAFHKAINYLISSHFLEIHDVEKERNQSDSPVLAPCSSEAEESREETEQRRGDRTVQIDPNSVSAIFEHWQNSHGHPTAKLDTKRRRRIESALKDFKVEELMNCISGYLNSPHHMGTDPKGNGVKYDDIELFLRDQKRIETGLRLYANPPRPPPPPENATDRIKRLNGGSHGRIFDVQPESESGNTVVPFLGDVRR